LNKTEREQKTWDRLTWGIDKLTPLIVNPVTAYVSGFVLANVLENTVIGHTSQDKTKTIINPAGAAVGMTFPWLLPFMELRKEINAPAGTPITALTSDQAQVLRAGLVAMAVGQSGMLSQAGNVVTGIAGLIK